MADNARRIPGKVEILLAFNDLLQGVGEYFGLTATHQIFGINAGDIGQLGIGAWRNGINGFLCIEKIELGTGEGFTVLGIHNVMLFIEQITHGMTCNSLKLKKEHRNNGTPF